MSITSIGTPGVWRTASGDSRVSRVISPIRLIWRAAERRIASATTPRPVIDGDRRTARVLASSAIVRRLDALVEVGVNAWSGSATAASLHRMRDTLVRTPAARLRRGGAITAIASATALTVRPLASTPAPLTWIVPAVFGVGGLLLTVCAPAIAHACEDRRR